MIKIKLPGDKPRTNEQVDSMALPASLIRPAPCLITPRHGVPILPTDEEQAMNKLQLSQKNQLFKTQPHDPYLSQRAAGSASCSTCGVLYHAGNWTWKLPANTVIANPEQVRCPACRRIDDDKPAGTLRLSGGFLSGHRDEIRNLIQNTEKKEKAHHALERILKLSESEDDMLVSTTGIHLANRLGHALEAAFKGRSQYRYSENDSFLSISWARD